MAKFCNLASRLGDTTRVLNEDSRPRQAYTLKRTDFIKQTGDWISNRSNMWVTMIGFKGPTKMKNTKFIYSSVTKSFWQSCTKIVFYFSLKIVINIDFIANYRYLTSLWKSIFFISYCYYSHSCIRETQIMVVWAFLKFRFLYFCSYMAFTSNPEILVPLRQLLVAYDYLISVSKIVTMQSFI